VGRKIRRGLSTLHKLRRSVNVHILNRVNPARVTDNLHLAKQDMLLAEGLRPHIAEIALRSTSLEFTNLGSKKRAHLSIDLN
jgi:hypothetical protein